MNPSDKEPSVSINRRQFVTTSAMSVAALGLGRVPAGAQAGAQAPAAPPVTKFEEIRRGVGYFTGNGGTIGYLINGDGALAVSLVDGNDRCLPGFHANGRALIVRRDRSRRSDGRSDSAIVGRRGATL